MSSDRLAGTVLSSCPSDSGLEPFNRTAITQARKIARSYLASQFASDIAATDRSWWTEVFNKVAGGDIAGRNVITHQANASDSPAASQLAQACGERLVKDSIAITVGGYSNFTGTLYLLDRRGHPLVYDAR